MSPGEQGLGGAAEGEMLAGRYRLLKKLGKGGMGEVFLAEHIAIQKRFAIKILLEERAKQANQKERFLNEARATARIRHPNVIDISDFGETEDGRVFFAMEYLEGEDLKRFLRRKHIVPWGDAAPILLQLCSALASAHGAGIIHRDLKPDNIYLIENEGRSNFVKVLDFGLAKMLNDDGAKKLTKTGIIVGTPAFLSPEQIKGDKIDHRADIYALGLITYRMLCGALPFKARTVVEMLRKQLMEPPLAPSTIAPEAPIPKDAEQIALKALAKEPGDRYFTTDEMASAIAAVSPDLSYQPARQQGLVPELMGRRRTEPDASKTETASAETPKTDALAQTEPARATDDPSTESGPIGATGPLPATQSSDRIITPLEAEKKYSSQLLSRPDEVEAAARRRPGGSPFPKGLIIGVAALLAAIVVLILIFK